MFEWKYYDKRDMIDLVYTSGLVPGRHNILLHEYSVLISEDWIFIKRKEKISDLIWSQLSLIERILKFRKA